MTPKKKTKKRTKSKTAGKKTTKMKRAVRKKLAKKKGIPERKLATKSLSAKTRAVKTKPSGKKTVGKKTVGPKTVRALMKQDREKSRSVDEVALPRQVRRSGGQSGDLQGLSSIEGADSESVDELLEEGNAFEAGVVTGVEDARDSGTTEVRTHEVPEDDVPAEYLDKE
jgi:hypothetical protein